MENEKTGFFSKILKSITDFKMYPLIIKESVGRAIGYLVLLSLIIGLLGCIKPIYLTNKVIDMAVKTFESEIPYFNLSNGELTVEDEMPMVFEQGSQIIIIDTTNQIDKGILNDYYQGFILYKNSMINKQGPQYQEIKYTDLGNLEFDRDSIKAFMPKLKYIIIPIIIVFVILGAVLGKLFSSLIVSILGLIVNAISKGNLKYDGIYKIGIYSLTLPSIIKLVIKQIPIRIPFFGMMFFFAYYAIIIIYIYKAIIEVKTESL
ncbi:MAG: DUF1189 domain-containing protein [Epulopiscium sp.]|nr:DUF1189 domain-containing protein [Candidatus Epulonipiscium sp.]